MPFSKAQFAQFVTSLPDGTSEDDIITAAKNHAKQFLNAVTSPLTTAPSEWANSAADKIDQPSLTRSPLAARLNGFVAGATQGLGNVASNMTSPLSIALSLVGAAPEAGAARSAIAGGDAAASSLPATAVNLGPEFTAVGAEPAYAAPTYPDPLQAAYQRVLANKGRR